MLTSSLLPLLAAMQAPTLPAYTAPDQFQAHEAFNDLVRQYVLEARNGVSFSTAVETDPQWAVDFQLARCVWGQEVNLSFRQLGLISNSGYFCRFTVQPYEGTAYSTVGFFAHDGISWRYFSRIKPSDEALAARLPDDKIARIQPYAVSPYLDGSSYNYSFTYGRQVDNSPYIQNGEGFFREDPYSSLSRGTTDQVIGAFERDDYRRRLDLEDHVRFPKGTPERNKTGY